MQADIIGKENSLSGRIWLEPVTDKGRAIFDAACMELYGELNDRILYVTLACEGAFVVSQMARQGAIVQMPHYVLNGCDGENTLRELG